MKTSKFSLHRISAAVLSVMASAALLALEANPTDKVHGRQITVTGTPVIERGTGPQVRVRTLPTAHDEDSTDTHTGWRYVWQVARTNVGSEAVSTNPGVVPVFSARSQDYDKAVRVCLKAVASSGYPVATQTSEQVCSGEMMLTDSAPTAYSVTISGVAETGQTLTGNYAFADAQGDVESGSTFRWYRADNAAGTSNKVAISGATGKTYAVQSADRNKYLIFEVTPRAATGKPTQGAAVASAATAQVPGTAPMVNNITFSGGVSVGNTLTGNYNYTDAENDADASTFQWFRADNASGSSRQLISGATSKSYVVQTADRNKFLILEITPRSVTGIPNVGSVVTSAASAQVPGTAPVVSNVSINSSSATVGNLLRGDYRYFDAEGDADASVFQWYRADTASGLNKQAISGATTQAYTVQPDDSGKFLVFEVRAASSNGYPNVGNLASVTMTSAVVSDGLVVVGNRMFTHGKLSYLTTWAEGRNFCENLNRHGFYRWEVPESGDMYSLLGAVPGIDLRNKYGWPRHGNHWWTTNFTYIQDSTNGFTYQYIVTVAPTDYGWRDGYTQENGGKADVICMRRK